MDDEEFWFLRHGSEAYPLYLALRERIAALGPFAVKVQKTQIDFRSKRLFACISMPRRKGEAGLLLTFGLPYPVFHPRIAERAEPYPGRWTHHLLFSSPEELDADLVGWLQEAYAFADRP